MTTPARLVKLIVAAVLVLTLSSCDDVAVYGSVGMSSSYGGYNSGYYGGGPRYRTSVSVGGRLY